MWIVMFILVELRELFDRSFQMDFFFENIDDSRHLFIYGSLYSRFRDLAGKRINTYFCGLQKQSNAQSVTARHINIQGSKRHISGKKQTNGAISSDYFFQRGENTFVAIFFHYSASNYICGKSL